MSCRWISAPPQIFMDCRGYPEELPHHGLHHRLQGIPSLAPGAPPCPLTLGTAELFPSHILTPLFSEHYYPHAVTFFSIHRYMITVVFLPSFLGPIFTSGGSYWSIGSIRHGSFKQHLTEPTPVALLLPKPGHTAAIQHPWYAAIQGIFQITLFLSWSCQSKFYLILFSSVFILVGII